jgi:hypothetical protein
MRRVSEYLFVGHALTAELHGATLAQLKDSSIDG